MLRGGEILEAAPCDRQRCSTTTDGRLPASIFRLIGIRPSDKERRISLSVREARNFYRFLASRFSPKVDHDISFLIDAALCLTSVLCIKKDLRA